MLQNQWLIRFMNIILPFIEFWGVVLFFSEAIGGQIEMVQGPGPALGPHFAHVWNRGKVGNTFY